MDLTLFERQTPYRKWVGTEVLTVIYIVLTTLVLLALCQRNECTANMLLLRLGVAAGLVACYALHCYVPTRFTLLLRYIYPLALLAVWYPDTYDFCRLFENLDPLFARADQVLFGCQPSLEFSRLLSGKIWSELFHLGYWAYYPMIFITVIAALFSRRAYAFPRTAFVVLASFFLYYLVYLFVPVAGPQYYFCAVGIDTITQGHFPEVGDWFRSHTEMLASPGPDGLFRGLVENAQASGERPTAAFPSSHVGMSTVLMLLLRSNGQRRIMLGLLPFYVLLCGATVYIQAHYLVDVFAGWLSAFAFYLVTSKIYAIYGKDKIQLL